MEQKKTRNTADFLVECLEEEGVHYIFGIPGEENLAVMDALEHSKIEFITVRHEQGAAFMADVYGRLTGKAGVCMATLGPGATNLITGVADADCDGAPLVAISGQVGTDKMHITAHQYLDLRAMFEPITRRAYTVVRPDTMAEITRLAFKYAEREKPGATFIDLPVNISKMPVADDEKPLQHKSILPETALESQIEAAASMISYAKNRGKGCAVRQGMLAAKGDVRLFTDCDLAYGTDVIRRLYDMFTSNSYDIIIGSRNIGKDGYEGYTPLRRLASKTYIQVLCAVGGFKLSDSQCGFKAFSAAAAEAVFRQCETDGFAFDFEAILWATKLGMKIKEIPVKIINHRESKVHVFSDTFKMLRDLRRMKRRIGSIRVELN